MKLIAKLEKPYTDEERCNFIVEQNHQLGYEIRETETELQAWGYTEEEKEQQEEERIANLTMTALDFVKVLEGFGLTSLQIKTYLDEHIELDQQLKYCQNVYCGVVQSLCPLKVYDYTITKEMVIQAFKNKGVI